MLYPEYWQVPVALRGMGWGMLRLTLVDENALAAKVASFVEVIFQVRHVLNILSSLKNHFAALVELSRSPLKIARIFR